MQTRYGTAHFSSLAAAVRYYAQQGISRHGVMEKLKAGEIFIGKPTCKESQRVELNSEEGRYFITERAS